MNIEEIRHFCLSFPSTIECFPFDEVSLVFKVQGKMFALLPLDAERPEITLKCEPNWAIELKEAYEAIVPAFHFNKKHWITVRMEESLSPDFVKEIICHAYEQVVQKLPLALRPAYVATIGFFDGVHRGHRYLIEQLKTEAKLRGLQSMLITFEEHPRALLSDTTPPMLTTTQERIERLRSTHVDRVAVLKFTTDLAALTAEQFMRTELKKKQNVKMLLLGYDHLFGSDRLTDFEQYRRIGTKLGIEVVRVAELENNREGHISSSAIRQALQQGNITMANRLLGYRYTIRGVVVAGQKLGRTLGFPTANVRLLNTQKLLPSSGVYIVGVLRKEELYHGVLNIGYRPTIEGKDQTIEVNILDFSDNIYGECIALHFLHYLRKEEKFGSLEELKERIESDCREARLWIKQNEVE